MIPPGLRGKVVVVTRDALLVKWKDGDLLGEMSDEAFERVLDVNLRGVFVCTRAVVPHMIAGGRQE